MKKFHAAAAVLSLLATALATGPPAIAQTAPTALVQARSTPVAVAARGSHPSSFGMATAKKTSTAKIVLGKTKTTVTTKPHRYVKKIKRPALTGSTAKNRRLFAKQIDSLLATEYKAAKKWNPTCNGTKTLTAAPRTPAIYKKRYASVTMDFWTSDSCYDWGDGQGHYRSVTLDLKTGKSMSLSAFVDQDDFTTKMATHKSYAKHDSCITSGWTAYRGYDAPLIPRPSSWSVSNQGLRVWYQSSKMGGSECGSTSTVLPWAEVATKKAMSGTIRTRVYVKNYKWLKDYGPKGSGSGDFIMFSTKGCKVAVAQGPFPDAGVNCGIGIRSGKTALLSNTFSPYWYRMKLADTSKNPKLAAASLKGGYKPATSKQIREITEFMSPKNALGFCGG